MKHRSPLWPVFVFGIIGIACLSCLTGRAALITERADSLSDAFAKANAYYATAPKPTAYPHVKRVFRVPPTGSMRALIDSNHVAVVERVAFAAVRVGDIAAFACVRSPADMTRYGTPRVTYLMHEVIRVTPTRIYTRGLESINNPYPAVESFGPSELVGVIRRSWRFR